MTTVVPSSTAALRQALMAESLALPPVITGAHVMRDYRIYTLTANNSIIGVPAILACKDDIEAVNRAQNLLNGLDLEVWDAARRVTRIKSLEAK
jgi:hypothetical protein